MSHALNCDLKEGETKTQRTHTKLEGGHGRSGLKQVYVMRPLIKRTFVVTYRKTDQGLEAIFINEVEVKPFASPLEAGDQSGVSSSAKEAESVSAACETEFPVASFSKSFLKV